MRLKVPLTGTVLDFNADAAKLDNIGISGHPDNPVQIALDLGNVSWRLVGIDLVSDLAEIEVTPADSSSEPDLDTEGKQKVDKDGKPLYRMRPATLAEKQALLADAQFRVSRHVTDPAKRLVKSAEVMKKYADFQSNAI